MGIPVDNKTEAIFANFKYNLSEKNIYSIWYQRSRNEWIQSSKCYTCQLTLLVTAAAWWRNDHSKNSS